jgi:hypothetical protein
VVGGLVLIFGGAAFPRGVGGAHSIARVRDFVSQRLVVWLDAPAADELDSPESLLATAESRRRSLNGSAEFVRTRARE